MKNKAYLYKRTFKALKYTKGSQMYNLFNEDPIDSEYQKSYKYILKWINEDNIDCYRTFRLKREAISFAEELEMELVNED